jgi:hypothetical protein
MAKWCFQETLVLAFPCGRIQAEWGILKVRKGNTKGSMVGHRWSPPAERTSFSFSCAFKTYTNPWGGQIQEIPTQ